MSHILSQWLNCDVNLSKEISPSELDSAFRNGFLLGELLDRLALQDDFKASYVNSSSVDASIKNFSSLEQTLREKLAITLTSNSAYDLITAKPGAAAKLLYQIKSSILPKHFHLTSTENDVKYKPRPIDKAITGDVAVDKNGPRWVRNTPPPLPAPKWTDAEESYPPSEDSMPGGNIAATSQLPRFNYESPSKRQLNERQHKFFSEMLRAKLKRSDVQQNNIPSKLVKPSPVSSPVKKLTKQQAADNKVAEACEPHSTHIERINVATTTKKISKIPMWDELPTARGPTPPPATNVYDGVEMSTQVERAYQQRLLYKKEQKIAKKEKLKSDTTSKFLNDVNKFESVKTTREKMAGVSKTNPSPPLRPSSTSKIAVVDNDYDPSIGEDEPPIDVETVKKFLGTKALLDSSSHVKAMASSLPPPPVAEKHTVEQLERIRIKKLEEQTSRKDREQRRKKLLLTQQKAQEKNEKDKIEHLMLEKIGQLSKQERRIAEQLMGVRHEKDIMRQNRLFREQQYSERRQKDYEEALERERDLCVKAKSEYQAQTELQLLQHKEVLQLKADAKHRKNYAMCEDLVNQIVLLSFKISQYRELNDKVELPKKLLRQWMALFLENKQVDQKIDVEMDKDRVVNLDPDNIESSASVRKALVESKSSLKLLDRIENIDPTMLDGIRVLDEKEFKEYLDGNGDWKFGGSEKITQLNRLLGSVVNNILEIVAEPEPVHEAACIPTVPVRIALFGKPCSGKFTIARELCEKFGLHLVSIDELVETSIIEAKTADISKLSGNEADAKKPLTRAQIGAKMQLSMMEGSSPDDQLLVDLVIDTLKRLGNEEEAKTGSQENFGWVLLNFPRNRSQAQLLEKELSGYEDPKPIKLGHLKRAPKDKNGGNKDAPPPATQHLAPSSAGRKRSLIAPSDLKSEQKSPSAKSGLDMVFMIDLANELVIQRATGRRVDTVTNDRYHLQFNSPSTTTPGLHERLSNIPDDGNLIDQLQVQISAFEEQEELMKDWFSRFGNMEIVDNSANVEDSVGLIGAFIQEIVLAKEHEKAEKEKKEKELDKIQEIATGDQPPAPSSATEDASKDSVEEAARKAAISTPADDKKAKPGSGKGKPATATTPVPAPVSTPAATKPFTTAATPAARVTTAKDAKTGDAGKNGGALAADPNALPAAEPLSNILVRSTGVDGMKQPSRELAEVLSDQWVLTENSFTDSLKFTFRCLRRERELSMRYFYGTKVNFKKFLERPDKKQALLEMFQTEFNSIEEDLRSDNDAKAELHQRAEDLREQLWEMSDKRREEADLERASVIDDKWAEDHSIILLNIYITMMQAEVDRYYGTRMLIIDYFRDSSSTQLVDSTRSQVKIQLVNQSSNPPIDINSALALSASVENSMRSRREQLNSAGANITEPRINASGQISKTKNSAGVGSANSNKKAPPPSAGVSSSRHHQLTDREAFWLELDNIGFADLQTAVDNALTVLNGWDEAVVVQDKEKKDKKKPNANEPAEPKIETEAELPQEYTALIENEEQILRLRLERIHFYGTLQLKELRAKGAEVYLQLEEWIGLRFQAEMDAISQMLLVIKEAIESENRLPNTLVLDGDKFKVDFGLLTYEPEPEPRPESPVEKISIDSFTVLQLLNVARQFKEAAPSGFINTKEFIDALVRLTTQSLGTELLPECYMTADLMLLQQLALLMDPYETGYLNWKRYIVGNARILPTPSPEYMRFIKTKLTDCPSFSNGKISKSDFLGVPLWFEDEDDTSYPHDETKLFNRSLKLKSALFHIFSEPNPAITKPSTKPATPSSTLASSEESCPSSSGEKQDKRPDTSAAVSKKTHNIVGSGATLIREHEKCNDDNDLFDVDSFLMCCTLDENAKAAVTKACALISEDHEEFSVSIQQLHDIYHYWMFFVDESHRLTKEPSSTDPFPLEMFSKVFEDAGKTDQDKMTPDEFFDVAEPLQIFNSIPLFETEDLILPSSKSRPSSSR